MPSPHHWGDKSRHERGYGKEWTHKRLQALERDSYLCQRCRAQDRLTELAIKPYDHAVDHIVPKAKGGTDDLSNLQSLCTPCHTIKTEEDKRGNSKRIRREDGWNP